MSHLQGRYDEQGSAECLQDHALGVVEEAGMVFALDHVIITEENLYIEKLSL